MTLLVFFSFQETKCSECEGMIELGSMITFDEKRTPKSLLCLSCADLDHLVYLPSGDAALTRRAQKFSTLSAVVLKWSRARKRNERQGILVEEQALEKAEVQCLSDREQREKRKIRDAERRDQLDEKYRTQFAQKIRELFPECPPDLEYQIAEHACQKYSGRVGRSADAKNLDETAIRSAVIAHIRHTETNYDTLLMEGYDRNEARKIVRPIIDQLIAQWSTKPTS